MVSEKEALAIADRFLRADRRARDADLAFDFPQVKVKEGWLIAPYNSVTYLKTRNMRDQLLDCWPVLVELATGKVRFGRLEELDFWRN
ncbi:MULTISPECIES: YrhB domain-containing protein [unclassified Streptomyces]